MSKRILLVDDDPDDAELFCEALGKADPSFTCLHSNDGTELVRNIKTEKFAEAALIFLDINMPQMNGWECLAWLKSNPVYKDIPVVMFSTTSNPRDVMRALESGAICFYEKPSNFDDLRNFLQLVTAAEPSLNSLNAAFRDAAKNKRQRIFTAS